MNRKLLFGFVSLVFVAALLFPAVKALTPNDTDPAAVSITVASQVMVDITPASLSWTGVNPGSEATSGGNIGGGIWAIEIENIGSENITGIWLNTTYETSNPFGSGDPLSYDAGNMIKIARTQSGPYYYADKVEWNQTKVPIYVTLPANTNMSGRFRDGNHEWFFAVVDTGSGCQSGALYLASDTGSGATLAGAHNETQTGDVDLTDGEVAHTFTSGVTNVTINGAQYDVYVPATCDYVVFKHWDVDTAPAPQVAEYLNTGTFTPGDLTEAYVKAVVPYGVAVGTVKQGTLTVLVTA